MLKLTLKLKMAEDVDKRHEEEQRRITKRNKQIFLTGVVVLGAIAGIVFEVTKS